MSVEEMGSGADRCAKTITLQQEVTVSVGPATLIGTRVWADVIVTCNRQVGHMNRHAFRWTFPDPESWEGET